MSRPDQAPGYVGDREERAEPAETEPRDTPPEGPAGAGGPDRADEWEGYDVAILNAVLDS
jgi:hypothetical protein